jgi:hypothetical protein
MAGVTYDTGALVAAERNDRRRWALHAACLVEEVIPVVPSPVLAEAWRGGSQQGLLPGYWPVVRSSHLLSSRLEMSECSQARRGTRMSST